LDIWNEIGHVIYCWKDNRVYFPMAFAVSWSNVYVGNYRWNVIG